MPDNKFSFNGSRLENGNIVVNQSITVECLGNRAFQSSCVAGNDSDVYYIGVWEPLPLCPDICKLSALCAYL